ncbi:MAG: MFS transporter [Rhodopirellula sp. JB053]
MSTPSRTLPNPSRSDVSTLPAPVRRGQTIAPAGERDDGAKAVLGGEEVTDSNGSTVVGVGSGTPEKKPTPVRKAAFWEPLRLPLFRFFWIALLASNLGTWIHEVGAGWLMTTLQGSPEMVAAVRTSMSLPIVFLAIPAGVLADRIDKRRLLMATQMLLFGVTATLATLTLTGMITAWGLLGLTFVMGLGMVVHVPTWQSAIPELVPRSQISRAVGLGSISFNLARTLGPAIGGVLIASKLSARRLPSYFGNSSRFGYTLYWPTS